jgi:hypothetical protein
MHFGIALSYHFVLTAFAARQTLISRIEPDTWAILSNGIFGARVVLEEKGNKTVLSVPPIDWCCLWHSKRLQVLLDASQAGRTRRALFPVVRITTVTGNLLDQ